MESNEEYEERIFNQQQKYNTPNPPIPPKKVPFKEPKKPRNKSLVKKQTGKEPSATPKVKKGSGKTVPTVSHKKQTGFRFAGKNGFLTYPQYKGTETPLDIMNKLKLFFEEKNLKLESAIVALENHSKDGKEEQEEDPGVHYHIVFKCGKRIDASDPHFFDPIVGQHGDYKTCRQFLNSVLYTAKEQNYSLFNLDISAIRKAIESKTSVAHHTVANKILEKPFRTLEKVTNKWPGYMIQHKNKVEDFIEMVQNFHSDEKLPYYGVRIPWPDLNDPAPHKISSWVSNNFNGQERPHKQKQLYVWGPANLGKTHILMDLSKRFRRYIISDEEKFDHEYHDHQYDFATMDEFVGQKKVSWINAFVEGTEVRLNKKNSRNGSLKRKNLPVIFCSNKSLEEVYSELKNKSPYQFEALKCRFEEVELKKPFKLEFLEAPVSELREAEGLNPDPYALEEEEKENSLFEMSDEVQEEPQPNVIIDISQEEEDESPPVPLKRTKRIYLPPLEGENEEDDAEVRSLFKKGYKRPKKQKKKFLPDSDEGEDLL